MKYKISTRKYNWSGYSFYLDVEGFGGKCVKKFSISVFFPVYNDEETIPELVANVTPILKSLTNDYEVILVEDGSPDNSAKVVDKLSKKYENVRTIHHEKNKGYGGALKTGIYNSTKDLIFYTDGDGQYDVREITKLIPLIDDADVVNGYKIKRSDAFHRKVLGGLYNRGARILFNIKLKDIDCDFRLFRRKVFKDIILHSNSGVICVELVKKIEQKGFKIKEIPVHHYSRGHGTSTFFNSKRIIRSLFMFGKLWVKFMIRRDYD